MTNMTGTLPRGMVRIKVRIHLPHTRPASGRDYFYRVYFFFPNREDELAEWLTHYWWEKVHYRGAKDNPLPEHNLYSILSRR
jgi:hypothetical protein